MEYPKRVRVVYSDGAEEVGIAIDPGHVDVGSMGLQVKLRETIEIDSVPHLLADARKIPQGPDSDDVLVRLRVKPIPGWLTPKERERR
jgi:hypothetical protein